VAPTGGSRHRHPTAAGRRVHPVGVRPYRPGRVTSGRISVRHTPLRCRSPARTRVNEGLFNAWGRSPVQDVQRHRECGHAQIGSRFSERAGGRVQDPPRRRRAGDSGGRPGQRRHGRPATRRGGLRVLRDRRRPHRRQPLAARGHRRHGRFGPARPSRARRGDAQAPHRHRRSGVHPRPHRPRLHPSGTRPAGPRPLLARRHRGERYQPRRDGRGHGQRPHRAGRQGE